MPEKSIHVFKKFLSGKYGYQNGRSPLSEFEAILDLIDGANDRGKITKGVNELTKDWRWPYPNKVRRFIDGLVNDRYLRRHGDDLYISGYAQWYGAEKIDKYKELAFQVFEYWVKVTGQDKIVFNEHKIDLVRKCCERHKGDSLTIKDFQSVIDCKYGQWKNDDKMKAFIRWETFFSTKFNKTYLEEALNAASREKEFFRRGPVHQ